MEKRIIISTDIRGYLTQVFGVSERTIFRALGYHVDSDLARRIRVAAIEKGGEVVGVGGVETSFSDGEMVQTYAGRLRIVTELGEQGFTTAFIDGNIVERHKDMCVADYTKMQERLRRRVDVLL